MTSRTVAYRSFRNLQEVARKYEVVIGIGQFIQLTSVPVDERFAQELTYVLTKIDVRMSEASISEFLIAPILKEAWKPFSDHLLFWSHVPLNVEGEFEGYPDYLFTKISPLGLVRDKPYVLVVETKKDDFEGGWGQCLAALLAAQTLNDDPHLLLQGIVSNGEAWQFGKLDGRTFTRDPRLFTISDLPELFAALHDVLERARQQTLD